MQSVKTVTEFKQAVEQSTKPVFIKFWADWCGPCKSLKPKVDSLSKEYGEKMTFIEADVDGEGMSEITSQFGIRGIPYMAILTPDKTKIKEELIGNHSVGSIQDLITRNLTSEEPAATTIVQPA